MGEYDDKIDRRVADALRWVAQEAQGLKLSGALCGVDLKNSKIREAIAGLADAYQKAGT